MEKKEIWATGKRKSSIARVQFFSHGKGEISINKRSIKDYFPVFELQKSVVAPLVLLRQDKKFTFRIRAHGGGIRGQAEAVRLGIARALVLFNPEWRKSLKTAGYLKRDPRKKERKKPGLKRARRAPQWQKR
ncbi:30S ribosomal protein S9 [Patescibacteria group bacterium AH-259-L05]|nr:30S ribosomal protein S9 [Patescibacteria group bacterium AH-259-L05]